MELVTSLKQYLLFAGYEFYPSGGWSDLEGQYDTLEEAHAAGKKANGQWYHIVDTATGKMVASV